MAPMKRTIAVPTTTLAAWARTLTSMLLVLDGWAGNGRWNYANKLTLAMSAMKAIYTDSYRWRVCRRACGEAFVLGSFLFGLWHGKQCECKVGETSRRYLSLT